MAPTYRVRIGAPGASSATNVAARMGMPKGVLDRASALLDREDRRLDRMLSELAANREKLLGRVRALLGTDPGMAAIAAEGRPMAASPVRLELR